MNGRRMRLSAVTAATLLSLASCGDDGSADSTTSPDDSSPSTTAPVAAPATSAAAVTAAASSAPSTAAAATTTTSTLPYIAPVPDLKIDQMRQWMHFTSIKCGGPLGTWPLAVDGTLSQGGVTFVLSGSGSITLAGTTSSATGTVSADYTISVLGVPLSTGGQIAHLQGTADYADGVLTMDATTTGTSHGENPYAAAALPITPGHETIVFNPVAGTFC